MLTNTSKWSHARGNEVVPSRWQATTMNPITDGTCFLVRARTP
jgi:hypothetical protein